MSTKVRSKLIQPVNGDAPSVKSVDGAVTRSSVDQVEVPYEGIQQFLNWEGYRAAFRDGSDGFYTEPVAFFALAQVHRTCIFLYFDAESRQVAHCWLEPDVDIEIAPFMCNQDGSGFEPSESYSEYVGYFPPGMSEEEIVEQLTPSEKTTNE